MPDSFLELARIVEEKTSFTVYLVSPRHRKLKKNKYWGYTNAYVGEGGEIYITNLPQAVQFLGHEVTHILLEDFFNGYQSMLPLDLIMSEWVADRTGTLLARYLGEPYFSLCEPGSYVSAVAELGFTEADVAGVYNDPIFRKWIRNATIRVARKILSWMREKGMVKMVIQGEVYKIKCPWCNTITESNRLTPFASKLKCFSCGRWAEEECIVSFAYASMLDDEDVPDRVPLVR